VAHGFYSPSINLSFRILNVGDKKFTDTEVVARMSRAIKNKKQIQ